jgi:hypothetical protein
MKTRLVVNVGLSQKGNENIQHDKWRNIITVHKYMELIEYDVSVG